MQQQQVTTSDTTKQAQAYSSNLAASPGMLSDDSLKGLSDVSAATSPAASSSSAGTTPKKDGEGLAELVGNFPGKGKWVRPTTALGTNFKHVTREELPWNMQLYWPLTTDERALLTDLTSSYQTVTTNASVEDRERFSKWGDFCMDEMFFKLEHYMHKYVQFARLVPDFQRLRQHDKIALLKASALCWYHIRMAFEYLPEQRAWVNMFGTRTVDQLSGFFGDPKGVDQYASFCESFKSVLKNDMSLYALMIMLVLFDPSDASLQDRTMVNTVRDKYVLLLKHYLESQFSFLFADRYLAEVFSQLVDLRVLSQSSMQFYKHFSSQFKPLIAEVFGE
jgi:nuclear receptor subfamily 1 group I